MYIFKNLLVGKIPSGKQRIIYCAFEKWHSRLSLNVWQRKESRMNISKKLFGLGSGVSGVISNKFLLGLVLVLILAGQTLYAQQSDADAKQLTEIRSKAERGDARAQWELGKAFSNGELGLEKDQQAAFKWIHKAAEQNEAEAQDGLGFCYKYGLGVAQDTAEAVKWFRKGAEQNDAPSQYNLASCFNGGIGVAKDDVEAVKWFRKSAELNFTPALNIMGECYFKGVGVKKDMAEAYKWFSLAAAQGDEDAKSRVRYLEKKLKKDQIAEVKKQAAEWAEQHKKTVKGKDSQ